MLIWIGVARTQEEAPAANHRGAPVLTIEVSRKQLALRGPVSSVAHESILRQRAFTLFPQKTASFDLWEQPALPPGWALVSELTLRAAAETYSATVQISASRIQISGITNDAKKWHQSLSRVERNLLPGMLLEDQIIEIRSAGSFDRQCVALFRRALRGRKVEFSTASATLSSSAAPLLDELVQIAADCPGANLVITGHTDNTGQESGNLALSQSRADAIADYMIASGISATRIRASGAGSSQPLIGDDTPQAHQLNRRIDIEIAFPET